MRCVVATTSCELGELREGEGQDKGEPRVRMRMRDWGGAPFRKTWWGNSGSMSLILMFL